MRPGGTRLNAGSLRGRVIPVPSGVRPTESRVREALFDIAGPELTGGRFLDLFAGSGAVGLEAISRGASAVLQVDSSALVVATLRATYRSLRVDGVECRRLDLPRQLSRSPTPAGGFDLIFADPPYDFASYIDLVAGLPSLLATGGTAVVEHDRKHPPPERAGSAALSDLRTYGDCALSFYRASAPD